MRKVAILVFEQTSLFELSCAVEIFALARPEYADWYQTDIVCFDTAPINATGGIRLATKRIDELSDYDTLILPSWSATHNHVKLDMAEKITQFAMQGKRIISLCSGAFLLAQLGLLQHKKATTHWRYSDSFKQRFPLVNFVEDVLYTHDQNISCSAGSAAALDLCIDILRQDFGHEIANQVARRLVISPHRNGGQAQYVEAPIVKNEGALSNTLDWAIQHLDQPLNVDELAKHASMSRRSFDRHFKNSVGLSPKAWLNQQRIQLAKQLLETKNVSIEQLANQVGYENGITLRFNFHKYVGVSPSQYQSQYMQGNS